MAISSSTDVAISMLTEEMAQVVEQTQGFSPARVLVLSSEGIEMGMLTGEMLQFFGET
jgi:hypothetical protein